MVTREMILSKWDYDRETGKFYKSGKQLGFINQCHGYRMVCLGGRQIREHRLVWFLETGEWPTQLDHINGDKTDNRIENLRVATQRQNLANRRIFKNNISGYKGVRWNPRDKRWMARIYHKGKEHSLGMFTCKHEAAQAYNFAAYKMHGEFANYNQPLTEAKAS